MELPATLMYDYPTLGQYCDHLTDVLDSQELRKNSKGNVTAEVQVVHSSLYTVTFISAK